MIAVLVRLVHGNQMLQSADVTAGQFGMSQTVLHKCCRWAKTDLIQMDGYYPDSCAISHTVFLFVHAIPSLIGRGAITMSYVTFVHRLPIVRQLNWKRNKIKTIINGEIEISQWEIKNFPDGRREGVNCSQFLNCMKFGPKCVGWMLRQLPIPYWIHHCFVTT